MAHLNHPCSYHVTVLYVMAMLQVWMPGLTVAGHRASEPSLHLAHSRYLRAVRHDCRRGDVSGSGAAILSAEVLMPPFLLLAAHRPYRFCCLLSAICADSRLSLVLCLL
eukprot:scpid20205/ scgid31188/ 